ncbi:MAG: IPT/TIG domain-containing protein [Isosphaeraceae bacterium]
MANTVLPEPGAQVSSPIEGTIVRWRILYTKGGPYRLRVLALNANGAYTGVQTSAPETSTGTKLQSFPTSLPIKVGQTIGLDNSTSEDELGAFISATDGFAVWNPALADNSTRAPTNVFIGEIGGEVVGAELAFNADVVPRPAIVLLSPPSGPIAGETTVSIAGHDLSGATAVRFGDAPASFSVISDNQITAVSPASQVGPVDVTVTTPGGQSAAIEADRFTYTACVVPKLKGKSLKADRKKLRKASCKLGKVRGHRSKSAKVKKQSAKPGKVLPPGSKVNVKLG